MGRRRKFEASDEAILVATGIAKTPRAKMGSFLEGRFRDLKPSRKSFDLEDAPLETPELGSGK
jgi:hypothetical protein